MEDVQPIVGVVAAFGMVILFLAIAWLKKKLKTFSGTLRDEMQPQLPQKCIVLHQMFNFSSQKFDFVLGTWHGNWRYQRYRCCENYSGFPRGLRYRRRKRNQNVRLESLIDGIYLANIYTKCQKRTARMRVAPNRKGNHSSRTYRSQEKRFGNYLKFKNFESQLISK